MDQLTKDQDLLRRALDTLDRKPSSIPSDRSLVLDIPDNLSQAWIDDVVLQAHLTPPVWSDFALVETRPTIWEMAAAAGMTINDRMALIADDSLVIASEDSVLMLISIGTVPVGDRVFYQLSLHCLVMNLDALFFCWMFHEIAARFGLADFTDAELLDRFKVRQNGHGAEEYINAPERKRPVFVFPRLSRLTTLARKRHQGAHRVHSGFGAVIVSDAIFRQYAHHLEDRKFGFIGVLPGGEVVPIEGKKFSEPVQFYLMLERCPLLHEVGYGPTERPGEYAGRIWAPFQRSVLSIADLTETGEAIRVRWQAMLETFSEQPASEMDQSEIKEVVAPRPAPAPSRRKIALDGSGYPIHSSDIVEWAERKFGQAIVFLSRARKAISKARHPEPARIAKAIEALAGPKLDSHRGNRHSIAAFDQALLKLRMRDGFSNADRLKGQTGAAYLIEHQGRRMLLEKHLCSLSSGFNDPRMIRIYYVFDRIAQKIVIGWLPTHLPTSQS